jgi:hypothetical protein
MGMLPAPESTETSNTSDDRIVHSPHKVETKMTIFEREAAASRAERISLEEADKNSWKRYHELQERLTRLLAASEEKDIIFKHGLHSWRVNQKGWYNAKNELVYSATMWREVYRDYRAPHQLSYTNRRGEDFRWWNREDCPEEKVIAAMEHLCS